MHASFPYTTSTNALPRNTLHCEGKLGLLLARPQVLVLERKANAGKLGLHHEGKLIHASFPLALTQVNCQQQYYKKTSVLAITTL